MDTRFEELASAMKIRGSSFGYNFLDDHGVPLKTNVAKRSFVLFLYLNALVGTISLLARLYESLNSLSDLVNLSEFLVSLRELSVIFTVKSSSSSVN